MDSFTGKMKRSSMEFFEWGSKHGTFVGVVGGGIVGLIGLALYIQSDRDKMKNRIEQLDRDHENYKELARQDHENYKELARHDHENYKELARAELEAKVQQARAEVAQQFLLFGYSEEYKAYREKLKPKKDD